MPFIMITLGLLLIVTTFRGTVFDLGRLILGDFTGQPNFFYWIAALFVIGALGYVDELRGPSRMMLALVLIVLILSNKGFFAKFVEQLKAGSAQPPPPINVQAAATAGGGIAGGAAGPGLGGLGGTLGGVAGTAVGGPAGGAIGSTLGGVFGGLFGKGN